MNYANLSTMYRIGIIALFALLSAGVVQGQDWSQRSQDMQDRLDERLREQQERIDLSFDNQMKRIWIKTSLQREIAPPSYSPDVPKVFDPNMAPKKIEEPGRIINLQADEQVAVAEPTVEAAPASAPLEPMDTDVASRIQLLEREVEAEYYGQQVDMRFDQRMRFELEGRITEHRVAEGWRRLESSNYELLILQMTRKAQELRLNDWGYARLVSQISQQIIPYDKNARTLLQWFLLSQSGYIATVGYERDHLHLLMPTRQRMYGTSFVRGSEHKLYAIDLEGGDLDIGEAHVFPHHHPEATRIMDLRVSQAPNLPANVGRRTVRFEYAGRDYSIPLTINRNVVAYYDAYPFVDLGIYMGAPVSNEAREALIEPLRRAALQLTPRQGRSRKAEAVNFLLHFVQALPYKTDAEQFGGERYLFADEVLAFPASDCEDRSVLFAYLVREVVGLETIGLLYPGHAAAAVAFEGEQLPGDWVQYRGKRYLVCDPTYIGADIGASLPQANIHMAKVVN